MDFEIMPFEYLPSHIRWDFAKYQNREYGSLLYETVDDIDNDGEFALWYGIVFANGDYWIDEDFNEVLWNLDSWLWMQEPVSVNIPEYFAMALEG